MNIGWEYRSEDWKERGEEEGGIELKKRMRGREEERRKSIEEEEYSI
jgi:hypothetical protein